VITLHNDDRIFLNKMNSRIASSVEKKLKACFLNGNFYFGEEKNFFIM